MPINGEWKGGKKKLNKSPIASNDLFCQVVFLYFYINHNINQYINITDSLEVPKEMEINRVNQDKCTYFSWNNKLD